MISEDELINDNGQLCLLLRIKNCTGNVVDFDESKMCELSLADSVLAYFPISVDSEFKNQRNRTIIQAIIMVLRWRVMRSGYFDFQIGRFVKPMSLDQAAKNLDLRHKLLTGEDQHIEHKTLEDYYYRIVHACNKSDPYDF